MRTSEKYPQNCIANSKNYILNAKIDEKERKILWDYYKGMQIGDNCKPATPQTIRGALFVVVKFLEHAKKPIKELSKQDIISFLSLHLLQQ